MARRLLRRTLAALHADTSGAVAMLVALASPAMIGCAALAVDLGSLYLAERRLQGIADAAATSALAGDSATSATLAAQGAIAATSVSGVKIGKLETGRYQALADVPVTERFDPAGSNPNAVRVHLEHQVPLFFGSLLTGDGSTTVHARAVAAKSDLIAFDIGSKLTSFAPGLPNAILSQIAGVDLQLTDAEVALLGNTRIDVIDLADTLRVRQDQPGSTFGAAFDRETPLPVILKAMADASPDAATREVLLRLADTVKDTDLKLADLIDLGPYAPYDVNDQRTNVEVDAWSLLHNLLERGDGAGYDISLDLAAFGLANAKLRIAGGDSYERTPWLTLSAAGEVVLRTALTRIGIETKVATPLLALGSVRVPLYTELAAAEARLEDVDCAAQRANQSATLAVTPSLGQVVLGDITGGDFGDLSEELTFGPAKMVELLTLEVRGAADVALGGNEQHSVEFLREDIDGGVRKQVGTTDLARAATQSLVEDVDLTVSLSGLNLGLGSASVTGAVDTALGVLAPAVDGLLNQVTQTLGIKLGVAEVGVIGLRCGRPMIVA